MAGSAVAWVDGVLRPLAEAAVPPDDSAFQTGLGCYTTARVTAGRIRHETQVTERLCRDAATLGLGEISAAELAKGMRALATASFDGAACIVRFQASRGPKGTTRVVGVARAIGPEPEAWRAAVSSIPHPGPQGALGVKLTGRTALTLALAEAKARGADEVLLCDTAGDVVEGGRSNVVVVDRNGDASVPPRALGGVAGVALGIVDAALSLPERAASRGALADARELVALNSVRGARAIIELDGRPIGDGRPGPLAQRLAALLDEAA